MPATIPLPAPRLVAWLRHANPHRFWLGRHCVLVAWVGLSAAILLPPHGAGIVVCWMQGATGVPCPGCGMTRSLSCAVRGMFAESWNYHPCGLLVLALFLFTAAQSLFPKPARERLAQFMQAHALFFNGLYLAFIAGFMSFGAMRALVHCAHHL
jgi:hypothetical protein